MSTQRTERVARVYALALIAALAVMPIGLILYLDRFQTPSLLFMDHTFHLIAIGVATVEGLFVSYVSWRCYRSSGEPFMRWLTLGFLGFTVIYAPHGLFTPLAHRNPWLFILYGPVSRLAMAACLLIAILVHGRVAHPPEVRGARGVWWAWLGAFLAIDVAVALLAISPVAGAPPVRLAFEGGALCLSALCAVVMLVRRIGAPVMRFYFIATLFFAQSSLGFLLGKAWNHQWWLAHVIFASGFFLLSYGVIRAFLTTGAFSTVDPAVGQPQADRDLRRPEPSTMLSRS
jgi:two-component system, cell cycle response regulator